MNTGALARQYRELTPEERFRLIFAASGRGDNAERERLATTGQRIKLSVRDHMPYAQAFEEVATLFFAELLEEAGRYFDAFSRADDFGEGPAWERSIDLALAAGFMLRTKTAGWKLFCERLNVPPFLLWAGLPGFERLQRALDLAGRAAFKPEGFLCWMNRVRPAGKPELTEFPLTPERLADATLQAYRARAAWWGGA